MRRRRGRILLGDSTVGEAVLLWPIRFKCAEVFSWTALYINISWRCVYSVATCSEFDLCLTDHSERTYRQYPWSGRRRRDLLSRLHVIISHNIAIFIYLFSHYHFLCFCSCLCNCVWRVSENIYHIVPWAGSWERYSSGGKKMRLENGFQNVLSYLDSGH